MRHNIGNAAFGIAVLFAAGCGGTGAGSDGTSGSEVATSVVSGALNNTGGSALAWNQVPTIKDSRSTLAKLIDEVSLIRDAWAAGWTCTGGKLTPLFEGQRGIPTSSCP